MKLTDYDYKYIVDQNISFEEKTSNLDKILMRSPLKLGSYMMLNVEYNRGIIFVS